MDIYLGSYVEVETDSIHDKAHMIVNHSIIMPTTVDSPHDWKIEGDNLATLAFGDLSRDPHQPYAENTMQLFERAKRTLTFISESEVGNSFAKDMQETRLQLQMAICHRCSETRALERNGTGPKETPAG